MLSEMQLTTQYWWLVYLAEQAVDLLFFLSLISGQDGNSDPNNVVFRCRRMLVVGLDYSGDELYHPYCPFYHEDFISLATSVMNKTHRVFGFRVHFGESSARPLAGFNGLSSRYLCHMTIGLLCILKIMKRGVRVRIGHGIHIIPVIAFSGITQDASLNPDTYGHVKFIQHLFHIIFTHPRAPVSEINITSNYYLLNDFSVKPGERFVTDMTLSHNTPVIMVGHQYHQYEKEGDYHYNVCFSTDNDGIWVIHKCERHRCHRSVASELCAARSNGVIANQEQLRRVIRNGWIHRFGTAVYDGDFPDTTPNNWTSSMLHYPSLNWNPMGVVWSFALEGDSMQYHMAIGHDACHVEFNKIKGIIEAERVLPKFKMILVGPGSELLAKINIFMAKHKKYEKFFDIYCSESDPDLVMSPLVKPLHSLFKRLHDGFPLIKYVIFEEGSREAFSVSSDITPRTVRSFTISPIEHYVSLCLLYRSRLKSMKTLTVDNWSDWIVEHGNHDVATETTNELRLAGTRDVATETMPYPERQPPGVHNEDLENQSKSVYV